ncbi:MAG TPA: Type 1 glutamine amidotransferase-like domain-containing protein [Candidatus Limnocylindrales bacterium]|nr:Type 1 glutamine amidotransferase-like domain-containing protein [Candidatus Limnocylindrales bacterium]
MGPIGLHGGGEFLAGDEPFLRLVLETAAAGAGRTAAAGTAIRIAVVPTATASGRPDLSGAHGVAAFRSLAGSLDIACDPAVVPVVDPQSAADPRWCAALETSDLVYLPGGDPGLVVEILAGSPAWAAILAARARGAVIAGASAGAMAMAEWTWTPRGGRAGLGIVRGLVVVPHFERVPPAFWQAERTAHGRDDLGVLGLDERTGILSGPSTEASDWRVAGAGAATWLSPTASEPIVAHDGESIDLRGSPLAAV